MTALFLLALLYALSLFVSLYPEDIGEFGRPVVVSAGFILSLVLYYFQFYVPLIRMQVSDRQRLIGELLPVVEAKYRKTHPGSYRLRVNLMEVNRTPQIIGTRALKLRRSLGGYSEAEQEQIFRSGQGCCGIAMRDGLQCIYDREQIPGAAKTLSATQSQVTENLSSILSTPVFRRSDSTRSSPVAVLNLDSVDPVRLTGFDQVQNQLLVQSFAEILGALY